MKRSIVAALALALAVVAAPALAHERGEKVSFPVQGAVFVQHVEARLTKQAERVEQMIAKRQFAKAEADAIRAKVADGAAKVRAEAAKVAADGTVTKEEAEAVHAVAKANHGGGHHCDGKKKS